MPLGFAFQGVASKLGFRDKSQLKWRFWWMGVCLERVEIIPNEGIVRLRVVVEVNSECRCHIGIGV